MVTSNWSRSEFEYGRRVLNSGVEGARSGREAFLNGRSLTPFLSEAALNALKPAGVGACVGLLSGYRGNGHVSMGRILGFGFLGSLIGFASGLAWESRDLTASIAGNAMKNIDKVRDEHWLQKHPIDYA
jgi:hypothetical protein